GCAARLACGDATACSSNSGRLCLPRAQSRHRPSQLFRKHVDYDAFLRVLDEALDDHPCRVLAYCLMPTHWHFVLWPQTDDQMSAMLRWLTLTQAVRWQTHYQRVGSGHVYQNRFKASRSRRTNASIACCATSSGTRHAPAWSS